MNKNGRVMYNNKSTDDNISDDMSTTSISSNQEITNKVKKLLSSIELPLLINNIDKSVKKLSIENPPSDEEFIGKRKLTRNDIREKKEINEKYKNMFAKNVEKHNTDVKINDNDNDDDDKEEENENCVINNLRRCDSDSVIEKLYRLGATATPKQIAKWMKANGFENYIDVFDGFNYFDLRRLTRTDLIELCGIIKGIQMYNAIQMKPVLPLRTIYCAKEKPYDNALHWKGIYLHSLNAGELDEEIIARFNFPSCKHSVWMEGPYGINILLSNETVEYMEDDDMFLIQKFEYPSIEHYKIILKKYM